MERKTFKELYEEQKNKPTAAQIFISDIAALTKRSEMTVRQWLSGQQTPDELVQTIIAQKFNVSANSLFPKVEQKY